jgi:hypothetical protein
MALQKVPSSLRGSVDVCSIKHVLPHWFMSNMWKFSLIPLIILNKVTNLARALQSSHFFSVSVDTERGVNRYQVQFKTFFNLYLNHSTISNEQCKIV